MMTGVHGQILWTSIVRSGDGGIDLHEKDAAGIFEFPPGKYLAQVTGVAQESGETAIRFIQLDGTNLGGRVSSFSIRGVQGKNQGFRA